MPAVVDLKNVSVVRPAKILLDRISWTVRSGERWVILGPNGAGKSTLLQIVAAAMHPSSGKVRILGERLGRVDVFDLRTRIGLTSTAVADSIPASESVRDAIVSAAYAVAGRWHEDYDQEDFDRAGQIMGELGISALSDRTFGTLSEGERKRVTIARALMTDPELLLLDEPGGGLDLGAREDLLLSLEALAGSQEAPVLVMVSHHVEEIPLGFTHVLMMRDGRIVASGPIDKTMTSQNLGYAFGMRLILSEADGRYTARRAAYTHRASGAA
ncbi:MAG: ABC transporter ATP-binding protein [Aeromicrobium sp.]